MNPSGAPLSTDPYALLPALYDIEHDHFEDDLPLILHFAATSDLPVLEAGSGTGRVLQAFAENDVVATGIDQSQPMLDAAVTRLSVTAGAEGITLVHGDMRAFQQFVAGEFGLVVYSLNALMHLPTIEDQLDSLASAHAILAPEGAVLIDLMHPHPEQLTHLGSGPLLEGSWTLPDNSMVDKWSMRIVRPASQLLETTLWYDIFTPDGGFRRIRTSFDHRYVHASELHFMLESCGFGEISLFGGYDMEPFDDDSDRIIAHAIKLETPHR